MSKELSKPKKITLDFSLFGMAGEIGLLIAIPVAIIIPITVKIDKYFETLPLFIIVGLFLSMIVSFIAVKRKVNKIQSHGR